VNVTADLVLSTPLRSLMILLFVIQKRIIPIYTMVSAFVLWFSWGNERGYALVYGNKIGSNLFFARRELLNDVVRERSVEEYYVRAKYR